jgi:hypothetical protein
MFGWRYDGYGGYGSDQAIPCHPTLAHDQTTLPFPGRIPLRRGTLSNGQLRRTLKSRRCLRVSTQDWYHARSETPMHRRDVGA